MRRHVALRVAFAACAISVLTLALLPGGPSLPTTGWDKSNHVLAFSSLALLGRGAFPGRWTLLLAGLLAFGGLIEVLQWFTDYRSAEWADLLADSIGLGLTWLACELGSRWPFLLGGSALGGGRR